MGLKCSKRFVAMEDNRGFADECIVLCHECGMSVQLEHLEAHTAVHEMEKVEALMEMGFAEYEATMSLARCDGDLAKAKESLLFAATTSARAGTEMQEARMELDKATYSIDHLSSRLRFGPAAFGPLQHGGLPIPLDTMGTLSQGDIVSLVLASLPDARHVKGERNSKLVTQMIADIYSKGLHMHGGPTSAVNSEIQPAMRHILQELSRLPAQHAKRINVLRLLVEACQDCQQVQARTILRIFGDFMSVTQTLESQLKYSLLRAKEAALQRFITRRHPKCDGDHTQLPPHKQRAHVVSGYLLLIGEEFGFDGLAAAREDRFLSKVMQGIGDMNANIVIGELVKDMSVKEWLQTLLADINNQAPNADRLIERECIFTWAKANMDQQVVYRIFYDEDRASEFADLDPKEPTAANRYQPFLSCSVLVDLLLRAGMVEIASFPCEVCGKPVDLEELDSHLASHQLVAHNVDSEALGSSATIVREDLTSLIPCDYCDQCLPFELFSAHLEVCECEHQQQQQAAERKRIHASAEPGDVAMRIVDVARAQGVDMPDALDSAREVCNFDLALQFAQQLRELIDKIGREKRSILSLFSQKATAKEAEPEIVYHWTKRKNIDSIVNNNLRRPGEMTSDGSQIVQAHGAVHGEGIYAYDNISSGRRYGKGAPCALLCLALPGRALEGSQLTAGYDSLVHGAMRVYRRSSQVLPLYLTNESNDAMARIAAGHVIEVLRQLKAPNETHYLSYFGGA